MSSNRRDFIRLFSGAMAGIAISSMPLDMFASEGLIHLTILHTNDTHSRIEPFPQNDPKYPGMGGVARRSAIIKKIRSEASNVLLLDAGDIFQGTPYFNMYGGEPELKLMSMMGYDAATIGNHDFDNGIDGLAGRLQNMNFPFLNVNYNFSDTSLSNKTLPYKIFNKGGIRVGVFGIGIELAGLVDSKLYGKTIYEDPLNHAITISKHLKKEEECDFVICLSHLGYQYDDKKISDVILAKESSYIDLIIGGHTHTFLDQPVEYKNKEGKEIFVAQVGWAGIRLGRIDYIFSSKKKKKDMMSATVKICENTIA